MNRTIYKYPLRLEGFQRLLLPDHAQILSVHLQQDTPTLWALVDEDMSLKQRLIHIIATGDDTPRPWHRLKYIGTTVSHNNVADVVVSLVWHVFEEL